jgi:uncharacterized protein
VPSHPQVVAGSRADRSDCTAHTARAVDATASAVWTATKAAPWSAVAICRARTAQTPMVHAANIRTTGPTIGSTEPRRRPCHHSQRTVPANAVNDSDSAVRPICPAVLSDSSVQMLRIRVVQTSNVNAARITAGRNRAGVMSATLPTVDVPDAIAPRRRIRSADRQNGAMEPFAPTQPVATLLGVERGAFVIRVYSHLLLAVGAFVAFETVLFSMGAAEAMYDFLIGASSAWLLILGAFMVIQWLATSAAHNLENESIQYAGLFGMAAGQALIFAPFLYLVFNDPSNGSTTVAAAAAITAFGFAGLTTVAFVTRKDLSFLRPMLMWGGIAALVLIVAAVLFGLSLGIWFSVAMIALAGGSILYQTQQIMARYPSHAHVGAAVQLFASVMMLFWYVLRLLSQLRC